MKTIHVPPLRWHEHVRNWLFVPGMYFLAGTIRETPQRTHPWNNRHLSRQDVKNLLKFIMVHSGGVTTTKRWIGWFPRFHIPILGGWRDYIVVEPTADPGMPWHVGWIAVDAIGVSRIKVTGPVRVLLGDNDVFHFGLDTSGVQIAVRKIGTGRIWEGGPYAQLPFF